MRSGWSVENAVSVYGLVQSRGTVGLFAGIERRLTAVSVGDAVGELPRDPPQRVAQLPDKFSWRGGKAELCHLIVGCGRTNRGRCFDRVALTSNSFLVPVPVLSPVLVFRSANMLNAYKIVATKKLTKVRRNRIAPGHRAHRFCIVAPKPKKARMEHSAPNLSDWNWQDDALKKLFRNQNRRSLATDRLARRLLARLMARRMLSYTPAFGQNRPVTRYLPVFMNSRIWSGS